MTLHAAICQAIGSLDLDVELTVRPGEVVALLGPNGAGKSSILRAVAGLRPLDRGRIALDDDGGPAAVLDEPSRGLFVPPEQRPIGVVFQDYLLFPHLSALENVAFGLRARGTAKAAARRRAREWLDRVGVGDHAGRRPAQLSGGQAQRVALARALATTPRVLLLDEPLAALDAATRDDVRRDLRRRLAEFPGVRILVTHDPIDAYALADRVVVVEDGRVVQSGPLPDVAAHPRSRYVAELAGVNLLTGRVSGHVLTTKAGARIVASSDAAEGESFAVIRPQAVSLHLHRPDGSPRNTWRTCVADVDQFGDRVRVRLTDPIPIVAEITPAAHVELGLRNGDEVWASVKASEITTYPA